MSSSTAALVRGFRPPSALAGRLATQSLLFALGEGTFMTGSAVFFTQVVGLSAAQVGLGLTIAGVAAFIAALPAGKLVDRYGPKRMWALSATGQAAPVRGVAVHRRLRRLRRDGGRHGGRRLLRRRRPRRLHDRRAPAARAGEVAGLHVLRAQRRLHPRGAARRHRAGVRVQRRAATRCRGSPPRCSSSTRPRSCGCPNASHDDRTPSNARRSSPVPAPCATSAGC